MRSPEKPGELILKWYGNTLNIDKKREEIIEVPALNVFDILEEKVVQKPEKHIEIRFSDPLLKAQNLTGFEAVSLKAVEIRVIQIFKNNVLQFFQENKLNGDSGLKKVGHLVYSVKVDLNPAQPGGLERWDLYKVNLAELFQIEQGTIYHVGSSMKKEYALLDCGEEAEETTLEKTTIQPEESYNNNWDNPGWYSDYYYPEGFQWDLLDNPCHVSYYNSNRFVSRNIFASKLGIIAKESRNHKMLFTFSNLFRVCEEIT